MARLSVLLSTEDSYPYHHSGTTTWCDALTRELAEMQFTVLAVTRHPYLQPLSAPAANVKGVITVPLSQMQDPAEYGHHESFPRFLRSRWSLSPDDIEQDYLPAYEQFLRGVASPHHPPHALAVAMLQIHLHLRYYDYALTQSHALTVHTFDRVMREEWQAAFPLEQVPSAEELAEGRRWLSSLMLPLAIALPRFDLMHTTSAGFAALPCVLAKLQHHTPLLLSEHGVYVRDQYLELGAMSVSPFVRWLLARLTRAAVGVTYAFADQISPSCSHHARWQQWLGAEAGRIRVIANGVNPLTFRAAAVEREQPTVVCVGRFSPAHGQADLIEAAALVRRSVPDVRFRLFGDGEAAYQQQCRELARGLGLDRTVTFEGFSDGIAAVLQQADIYAQAATADGCSQSIVEAMMSELAIVATRVGGVEDVVGDTALLVPPRDPVAMAESIAMLLQSPDGGRCLGQHARKRALHLFDETQFADAYRASYERLTQRATVSTRLLPDMDEPIEDQPRPLITTAA